MTPRLRRNYSKLLNLEGFDTQAGLESYHRGFNKVFYDHHHSSKHISEVGIMDRINNNRVERLHGTIRDRDKVMRAFGNPESSEKILEGHRIYYNFVRPHIALNGLTPAQEAGLDLDLGRNRWMGLIKKSMEVKIRLLKTTNG